MITIVVYVCTRARALSLYTRAHSTMHTCDHAHDSDQARASCVRAAVRRPLRALENGEHTRFVPAAKCARLRVYRTSLANAAAAAGPVMVHVPPGTSRVRISARGEQNSACAEQQAGCGQPCCVGTSSLTLVRALQSASVCAHPLIVEWHPCQRPGARSTGAQQMASGAGRFRRERSACPPRPRPNVRYDTNKRRPTPARPDLCPGLLRARDAQLADRVPNVHPPKASRPQRV